MFVPIFIDKKALVDTLYSIAETEWKEQQREEEERARKKKEKELKKYWEKKNKEEKEERYRDIYPHCTEMFNHFDMGNEWFPVNYKW